jgi:two-component system CheB/CheR fusion protein
MLLHEIEPERHNKKELKLIESVRDEIQSLNTDVRLISHRLHPAILQDLGLPAALKAMVQEFGRRENMPATYASQDLPESWSADAATTIYRIAQEALRNVSKHAGKTHVKVSLAGMEGKLRLRVMDFGVGFDQEGDSPTGGLGMISMQERARLGGGILEVKSALGQGTTVTATIPLEHHA